MQKQENYFLLLAIRMIEMYQQLEINKASYTFGICNKIKIFIKEFVINEIVFIFVNQIRCNRNQTLNNSNKQRDNNSHKNLWKCQVIKSLQQIWNNMILMLNHKKVYKVINKRIFTNKNNMMNKMKENQVVNLLVNKATF